MPEDERTNGKWKIEQCSVEPETAIYHFGYSGQPKKADIILRKDFSQPNQYFNKKEII